MTLQTGQVLNNRYRIVKLLGQGGYGAVYRAWDINFQMPCALKENTETSAEAQRQFMREAKILHTIRHASLPLVKDYFIIPGKGQYLVMDYIEGDDLATIILQDEKPLPEDQVLKWLDEICRALEFLHSRTPPIIHRDIKPANIKITPQGNAVLVDFGISKVYDPNLPTTQGARGVTPGYSPFEQYGNAPTDNRTDIYGLGATAYTLLSGLAPPESISRMAGQELIALDQINPEISASTAKAITKAMELMPENRFPNIEDFRKTLLPVDSTIQALNKIGTAASQTTPDETKIPQAKPFEKYSPQVKPIPETTSEEQTPRKAAQKTPPVVPAVQPAVGKKHQKRRLWALITVIGLIGITIIIFAWLANTNQEDYSIAGGWQGFLQDYYEERLNFPASMEIVQSDVDEGIDGVIALTFPDGNVEEFPFEGSFDGYNIWMRDSRGFHYRGILEGEVITGEYSPDCFECEPIGVFEIFR